jgi:transposase
MPLVETLTLARVRRSSFKPLFHVREDVLMARRNPWNLSDADWHRIEVVLPRSRGGRPRTDDRLVITGILHSLATGAPFAELDPYGNPRTLETRFRRWSQDGTLQRICAAIGFEPMSPHERHLRHGMGRAQRQAMRDKGWSRYW